MSRKVHVIQILRLWENYRKIIHNVLKVLKFMKAQVLFNAWLTLYSSEKNVLVSKTSIQWNSLGFEGDFRGDRRGTVIRIYFLKLYSINKNKIKVIIEVQLYHFPTFLPTRLLGIFSLMLQNSQVDRFLLLFLLMFLGACTNIY